MKNLVPGTKPTKFICSIAIVLLVVAGFGLALSCQSSVSLITMLLGLIVSVPALVLMNSFYKGKYISIKNETNEKLNLARKESRQLQKTLDQMSDKIEKANFDIATVNDLKESIEDYKKMISNLVERLKDYKSKYLNSKLQTTDVYNFAAHCWQLGYTDLFDPFLYMANKNYKRWMDDNAAEWTNVFDCEYHGSGDANEAHATIIRNSQKKSRPKNSTGYDGGKIIERENRRNSNTHNNDYDEER